MRLLGAAVGGAVVGLAVGGRVGAELVGLTVGLLGNAVGVGRWAAFLSLPAVRVLHAHVQKGGNTLFVIR